jgi:5'(3')-deoxyribonucleotidase
MTRGQQILSTYHAMIDGNVYLRRFEGEKILFDSPHNGKVPDDVHRVNGMKCCHSS